MTSGKPVPTEPSVLDADISTIEARIERLLSRIPPGSVALSSDYYNEQADSYFGVSPYARYTEKADTAPRESRMKPRIILRPGLVHSSHDGELHYIGALALSHLYQVPLDCCVIVSDLDEDAGWSAGPNDIVLGPRQDCKYAPVDPSLYTES